MLDNGCGNGRLLTAIKDKDVKYIGIDNCSCLLDIAKERYNREFICANSLKLPFENDFFDKVFSIAVIHHIPSFKYREMFLKEMYRVLKKNGICCISSWKNVSNKYMPFMGKFYLDKGDYFVPFKNEKGKLMGTRYVHVFEMDELEKLCLSVGFEIIKKGITQAKGKERNIYFVLRK